MIPIAMFDVLPWCATQCPLRVRSRTFTSLANWEWWLVAAGLRGLIIGQVLDHPCGKL